MRDNIVLDVGELRLKWAIDDVCGAVEALTTRVESIEDIQTLEATSHLLKSIQTYIKVVGDSINGIS